MRWDVTSGNFRIPIWLADKSSVQEWKVCQLHHIGILRCRRRVPWKGEGWQVFAQRILASKRMRGSGWDVPISLIIHYYTYMLHIYITAFHILQVTQTGADSLGVNSGASKLYVALRPQFRWSTLKPEMGWLLAACYTTLGESPFSQFSPAINDGYTMVYPIFRHTHMGVQLGRRHGVHCVTAMGAAWGEWHRCNLRSEIIKVKNSESQECLCRSTCRWDVLMMATIGYLRSDIMGYQWTEAILGQFGSFWAIHSWVVL